MFGAFTFAAPVFGDSPIDVAPPVRNAAPALNVTQGGVAQTEGGSGGAVAMGGGETRALQDPNQNRSTQAY